MHAHALKTVSVLIYMHTGHVLHFRSQYIKSYWQLEEAAQGAAEFVKMLDFF